MSCTLRVSYRIRLIGTDLALSVMDSDDGVRHVVVEKSSTATAQQWEFVKQSE